MAVVTPILSGGLSQEQREVISHGEGPLLVIAGPGAGKTEVMLRRVAYLVRERRIPPESVLVTTFTRKAAQELGDRLTHFVGQDVDRILITTIHGFCHWLLETYPDAHPYGRAFQVLDERGQFLLVFSHAKELGMDLPKGRVGEFLVDVIGAFNAYSEDLVDPARLVPAREVEAASGDELTVVKAYGQYLRLLRAERMLDFAGLQREAYAVLRDNADIQAHVQGCFRYVVVDEHQDTNVVQDLIIGLVAAPEYNLCVVGDDDQSIYRFRGATVQNFLGFPATYQAVGVRQIELRHNFRSTSPIVSTTARLIAHNPVRYEKTLVPHRGSGPDVLLVEAEDVDAEGRRLGELVEALRRSDAIARWSDVAVLFSSVKYYAEPLLRVFDDLHVPYAVTGDGAFFAREDIQQLKNLVILLGWPKYWRPSLLEGPVLGLRPETTDALDAFRDNFWELDDERLRQIGVPHGHDRAVLTGLTDLQHRVQAREHASILGLVHNLLALSGYVERLTLAGGQEAQAALLNLGQFTRLAEAFDRYGRSRSTYRFGEYLRSLPERSLDTQQPPTDDAVQVMTIHQAKGLEFPVVLVGSVIEGRLPNRARGRRFLLPESMIDQVAPPEIGGRRRERDVNVHISDQRRLLYVSLTRARDLLIIGTSVKVRKQRCKASRFLTEMGLHPSEPRPPETPVTAAHSTRLGSRPHLSFSAINAYLTCPLRYKFLYVDRIAVPTWHFAQYGTSLHRTLQAIHQSILRGDGVDEARALRLFEQHWIAFGTQVPDLEERFKATGRSYISRYVREHAASFSRVRQTELPFTYDAGNCLLSGQIDLLRAAPDSGIEIVDFKTRATAGIALIRADLQLGVYALACEARLDAPVRRLVLHLLADGREEQFEWSPDTRDRVNTTLREVAGRLVAEDFGPRPGGHCRECEFRALCPYVGA